MKCPHCNQEHPEGTKFCPETGERIVPQLLSCSNCGFSNVPANYKYCPECGKPLKDTIFDDNEVADDYELRISASNSSLPKAAKVMQDIIKTKDGPILLEDAYRNLNKACFMSGLGKEEALDIKDRLEKAGANISLKGFKFYVCDKCGATYRCESKPKKCNRCRTRPATFTRVMKEDVTFCPRCFSWKMNYEDGVYKCADCGMFSTIEEVNEYDHKL